MRRPGARRRPDRPAAERRGAEVASVLGTATGSGPDRGGVAIAAVALDHYYTSIESSLEMIGHVFDLMTPTGADWHRALLVSVSTGTTTRPAVLSPETASDIKDLLAFRHFLRHAYAADLEWKRMCDVAAALGNTLLHGRIWILNLAKCTFSPSLANQPGIAGPRVLMVRKPTSRSSCAASAFTRRARCAAGARIDYAAGLISTV